MIHIEATIKYKGYNPNDLTYGSEKRICCVCDECGRVRWLPKRGYRNICTKCSNKSGKNANFFGRTHTEESKQKMSDNKPDQTGKNAPNYDREIDIWVQENTNKHLCKCGCGRYIIIERKHHCYGIPKYYCKECNNNDMSGKNNPMFGKEHSNNTKQLIREKALQRFENPEERILHSCRMLGISREEWDGFGSVYCNLWCEELREHIRNKYNRVCFICGKTEEENGRKLDVHHIDYNKDCGCDGTECRLVPLCISCHSHTTFGDREIWEDLIMDMLEKKNSGMNIRGII